MSNGGWQHFLQPGTVSSISNDDLDDDTIRGSDRSNTLHSGTTEQQHQHTINSVQPAFPYSAPRVRHTAAFGAE